MSKNYRVWKWNVLANIRPVFFFFVQLYLCAGWYQVRYFTKSNHDNQAFFAFDSNPLSNLAFILCIVHAIVAVVTFIPRGVISLIAHFDSPSSKRLCEWSSISSAFLTLVILIAERSGAHHNFADTALLFFASILVNITAFNHIGIPDLFLFLTEICMIPLWFVFLAWSVNEETSGSAVVASTFVLAIVALCTWLQQRDYRRAFEGQHSLSKINHDFLLTINHALKHGDEKLKAQAAEVSSMLISPNENRSVVGHITSIRYWYLAISAALSAKEDSDEKYVIQPFVQICRDVFAEYEKAAGKSVPIFFDTSNLDLKITARANLFETVIFGLLEYNCYKDLRINRICRLSCVDDDGKDWKLTFEIICNLRDAEQLKRHNMYRRNHYGNNMRPNQPKTSNQLRAWNQQLMLQNNSGNTPATNVSSFGGNSLSYHGQHPHQNHSSMFSNKNDISMKYPLSMEKEPIAKSDFEATTSGSILTVIAEKLWQHKFEHSTDEMEDFYIEKIEISLPNDMCQKQPEVNVSVAPTANNNMASNIANNSSVNNSNYYVNNPGNISVNMNSNVQTLSKFQPWVIITQNIPESVSRTEIRSKLNKLLVPTQMVSLGSLRPMQRFGILLISEQLLSKLAQTHAATHHQINTSNNNNNAPNAQLLYNNGSNSNVSVSSNNSLPSTSLTTSSSSSQFASISNTTTPNNANNSPQMFAEFPDLISLQDLRRLAKYLIVVTDNDVDKSELSTQYKIEVERAIFSKSTLSELFETILMVYHDLRNEFDMTTPFNSNNNNINNMNNTANNLNNKNAPHSPHSPSPLEDNNNNNNNNTEMSESLIECVSRVRRLLLKSGALKEQESEDTILQDRVKLLRTPKTWENQHMNNNNHANYNNSNNDTNSVSLFNNAATHPTDTNTTTSRSRCASVLQLIDDPRKRRQAELALEFVPRLSALQESFATQGQLKNIDWPELRSKLHDVHTMASKKELLKLEIWLGTLLEVVNVLSNKFPLKSSHSVLPTGNHSKTMNSNNNAAIASKQQKTSTEDVIQDLEDVDETQQISSDLSNSHSNHQATTSHSNGLEQEVLQQMRQILSSAQLVLLQYVMN